MLRGRTSGVDSPEWPTRIDLTRVRNCPTIPQQGMGHLLGVALSFPAVVYTIALVVALVYWLFVIVGAAHVNLLGEGAVDAAMDGALDGAAKGMMEGAAKGMVEGAAEHLHDGAYDGADAGGDGSAGLMSALRLRSAPATVVLSLLVLFSWILSMAGMQVLEIFNFGGVGATLAKLGVLVLAPLLALFPTSVAVRPLARVFAPPSATRHASLVGKLCTIRTGTVTERFGEALLEDGGAGVVVRVRIDTGDKLARGDQAVIVAYDAERQEFTVAPMAGILDESPASRPRSAKG